MIRAWTMQGFSFLLSSPGRSRPVRFSGHHEKGCCYQGQLSLTPDWLPGQADENPRQMHLAPSSVGELPPIIFPDFLCLLCQVKKHVRSFHSEKDLPVYGGTRPSPDPTSCVCDSSWHWTARTSCAPRGSSLAVEPAGRLRVSGH